MPRIRDVQTMVELLADIGAEVELTAENDIRIDPTGIHKTELDEDLCRRIRASFLLAGPLLARFGRVTVPPPGGDVMGAGASIRTFTGWPSSVPRSRSTGATR